MDRARIKTFILLLLLAVNLVFLVLIVVDLTQTARQRSEARMELVYALGRMGITMDYDAIPEEGPQPVYFVGRDIDWERQVAAALLGEAEERDEGGGIYHYQSPRGQAQFRGGTFWAQFAGQGENIADTRRLLERIGFSVQLGDYDFEQRTYILTVDGQRVQNGQVTFHFADGYVQEINGTALWGTRQGYAAGPQQDAATALITLAGHLRGGDTVSQFLQVEMGYYLLVGSGYLELRPVWIVSTDGGVFSVDRQSGELRA